MEASACCMRLGSPSGAEGPAAEQPSVESQIMTCVPPLVSELGEPLVNVNDDLLKPFIGERLNELRNRGDRRRERPNNDFTADFSTQIDEAQLRSRDLGVGVRRATTYFPVFVTFWLREEAKSRSQASSDSACPRRGAAGKGN